MVTFSPPTLAEYQKMSMQFQANSYIKLGDDAVPVYFGTPDAPAFISGEVSMEIDREYESARLEITLSAAVGLRANFNELIVLPLAKEQVFQKKRWIVDMDTKKTGKVDLGTYRRSVTATIDPLWPSSFQSDKDKLSESWFRYFFDVKLITSTPTQLEKVTLQRPFDIWVLNSLDPSPAPPPSPTVLYQKLETKISGLVISFSIPSEGRVEIGQVLPVTLHVPPFEKSKFQGQAPILTECVFKLREEAVGNTKAYLKKPTIMSRYLFTLAMQTDAWPKDGQNGLERVVNLSLPGYPAMSTSAKTDLVELSYFLEVSLKIRAEGQKEKDAEVIIAQLPLKVVSPRQVVAPQAEQLPAYDQFETQ